MSFFVAIAQFALRHDGSVRLCHGCSAIFLNDERHNNQLPRANSFAGNLVASREGPFLCLHRDFIQSVPRRHSIEADLSLNTYIGGTTGCPLETGSPESQMTSRRNGFASPVPGGSSRPCHDRIARPPGLLLLHRGSEGHRLPARHARNEIFPGQSLRHAFAIASEWDELTARSCDRSRLSSPALIPTPDAHRSMQ